MSKLLNRAAAARRLGVARSTLVNWSHVGLFPPPTIVSPNNRNYWSESDLETWLASQRDHQPHEPLAAK